MWLKQSAATVIPTEQFSVSFNQVYRAYVVYYPGTTNRYVTRIAGIEMGFGPRYLLEEKLEEVRSAHPLTVPVDTIQFEVIEELDRPLHVLLGKVLDWDTMNEKRIDRQHPNDDHELRDDKKPMTEHEYHLWEMDQASITAKKKYLRMSDDDLAAAITENLQFSDKDDPGKVTGYEDSNKRFNDPEKIRVTVV